MSTAGPAHLAPQVWVGGRQPDGSPEVPHLIVGRGRGGASGSAQLSTACKPEMGDALRRASPDANKMEADAAAAHNLAGGQPGEVEEEWTAPQQQAVARHTRSAPHP